MDMIIPDGFIELDENEMMYLDGGGHRTTYGAASNFRPTMSVIGALAGGTGLTTAKAIKVFGGVAGWALGIFTASHIVPLANAARNAHAALGNLQSRHGNNVRVRMVITWDWLARVTGITVTRNQKIMQ